MNRLIAYSIRWPKNQVNSDYIQIDTLGSETYSDTSSGLYLAFNLVA